MAFPKLLQKLFQNNGAGDKLNKSIVPDLDYLPKNGGTVDGSVTINGTTVPASGSTKTYKEGIKFGWGSEISQSTPNGLDIWAKRGDATTVMALYGEKKDGDTTGNTPGIFLRAGNGTATKGLRLTTSAATIDGVEIATLNTASRNLGHTTMVGLGFAKDSTVTLVQFLQKLAEHGYSESNSVLKIDYAYANSAYVTDGTNTVRIAGGTLYLGQNTHNPSNDYGVAWGFFVPPDGTKLYRFRTYKDHTQATSDSPKQNIYPYESGGGLSVVAESYSANSWYRKYSDGWIEQGGRFDFSVGYNATVAKTFPLAFTNASSIFWLVDALPTGYTSRKDFLSFSYYYTDSSSDSGPDIYSGEAYVSITATGMTAKGGKEPDWRNPTFNIRYFVCGK